MGGVFRNIHNFFTYSPVRDPRELLPNIPPKSSQREMAKCAALMELFFSSLIPSGESHLAGCFLIFLSSKGRQREECFFTPVSNISSLVPTGSGQKLCLFCNFLPSRGGAREREKYKVFSKIIFSSQGIEHENSIFMNDFENFSPIW